MENHPKKITFPWLHSNRMKMKMQRESARAEEKIRFMTALLEEVNDAIITFDKDLMIKSWNKGAERIYGWTAEEVVGKYGGGSLRVDFPGASREEIFKELERTGSWKGELIHKRKDGSTAYILSSTSQLRDEEGGILGIMTINKDISEVIHSEKSRNAVYRISELAHSTKDNDELYSSIHIVIGELMDAGNLYIALLSPDGKTLSFPYFIDEKEASRASGTLGNGLTEFVLRTGKPLLARPEDVEYMSDRGMIELIGEPFIDWLGIPLKFEKETIGVLAVQSYNPKVRYGEKEKTILLFVSEQIALTIHRRKIQQELIEAKQNAEVSSKLTSALLANMNHELRTPMNGILGFAEILVDELQDNDSRLKASNILISGRRLMDTLDAIMDLSYLESDKLSRRFKPVNIGKIVRNVLVSYESVRKEKNLNFFHEVVPDMYVLGNEHLLQHLVKNLVDNAVKYTKEGGVTIAVEQVQKEGNPFVSIKVKDTGIGISPEHHIMIFDAFRQVSEGYGRKFEGNGLGLTISKKIVDLMDGEIGLVSVTGKGSEFTVLLPAAEAAVTSKSGSVMQAVPWRHPTQEKQLPDVLVVEDNLVNLQLLMVYIRDYCNIYSALDGKAAIEMTHQRKFNAILMDINLGPGMDGIQAMLEIRKRPDYQNVPVVAITGYASIGDSERLRTIGFSDYLAKPYEKEAIAELMRTMFPQ
jgi:PAS domain S-box-containing protein